MYSCNNVQIWRCCSSESLHRVVSEVEPTLWRNILPLSSGWSSALQHFSTSASRRRQYDFPIRWYLPTSSWEPHRRENLKSHMFKQKIWTSFICSPSEFRHCNIIGLFPCRSKWHTSGKWSCRPAINIIRRYLLPHHKTIMSEDRLSRLQRYNSPLQLVRQYLHWGDLMKFL
jgi:hypothetical protein